MSLKLSEVKVEDRGILSKCGVMWLGCDYHIGEVLDDDKKIYEIWEGWNIKDVSYLIGLN